MLERERRLNWSTTFLILNSCCAAWIAHVGEAAYAYSICRYIMTPSTALVSFPEISHAIYLSFLLLFTPFSLLLIHLPFFRKLHLTNGFFSLPPSHSCSFIFHSLESYISQTAILLNGRCKRLFLVSHLSDFSKQN